MELLSLEEFILHYENTGYLPRPASYTGKGKLNSKQLNTKYKDYLKKVEALNNKDHSLSYQAEWEVCRAEVYKRDNNECQLFKILTEDERDIAIKSGYNLYNHTSKISPAHFVSRSRSTELRCIVDNVVTMAIIFHNRIDNGSDPITGEFIGKDKVLTKWWKRVLPIDIYNKYKDQY